MYLHNKNVVEYAEIAVTDGNSWIPDIEGHSNTYVYKPKRACYWFEPPLI